ncbi:MULTISPECIES: hypothetical protein [Mesobacillus]|nr:MULTISPECIES: hypothetical protein [Mesobacillus]UYZ22627.1 hypothetical protein FOF60_03305 [Mesobacillus jeotgali]
MHQFSVTSGKEQFKVEGRGFLSVGDSVVIHKKQGIQHGTVTSL